MKPYGSHPAERPRHVSQQAHAADERRRSVRRRGRAEIEAQIAEIDAEPEVCDGCDWCAPEDFVADSTAFDARRLADRAFGRR